MRDLIEEFCVMCDWNPPFATLYLHRWEMCYAFSYDFSSISCALPAPNLQALFSFFSLEFEITDLLVLRLLFTRSSRLQVPI